jgi:hypothetical protein
MKIRRMFCLIAAVAACGDNATSTSATEGSSTGATTTAGATTQVDGSTGTPTTSGTATGTGTATDGQTGTDGTQGTSTTTSPGTATSTGADASSSGEPATSTTSSSSGDDTASSSAGTTDPGCGACDEPNQQCVDNVCITLCQGQDPDPCGPDEVCDVISGECHAKDAPCTLDGPSVECGANACGPGTVCDGQGECLPIAPCADVACTKDGQCWGAACVCDRVANCTDPALNLMNGPFSVEIGGIDFTDECIAWMVTLRSGTDYLRRLTPDGTLTQWAGVANLNMGEVKVLRRLTNPQLTVPLGLAAEPVPPPLPKEGYGEVAIAYTCCPTCGCQANPPQGVARLVEEDLVKPLPIVIVAMATQGNGPFGSTAADAGPQGLTWGADRVLYVGNSTANGDYNSADLDKAEQAVEFKFAARVTASAPVSPAHLLVALDGGEVYRFNVLTKQTELVIDLMSDVTSLSHDAFTGLVYAGLASLEVVELHPFTGEVASYQKMPGKGRVAVSPSGKLWYTPVKYIANLPLSAWDLPNSI